MDYKHKGDRGKYSKDYCMSHLPDAELIQKAQAGDKEAYKELFDKYNGKIMSYIYRYTGDYQKAEDITIETFLDVYKRLPHYREEGNFLPWVYRIATNFAKKEFRKRDRLKEVSLDKPFREGQATSIGDLSGDNSLRPDHKATQDELSGLLEEIMNSLDKKYRSVLLLCDVEGLSYEEAAAILKCKKTTVGTQLNRARKLLHDALKQYGYNLEG